MENEAGPSVHHLLPIPFSFFCEPRPRLGSRPSCSQPIGEAADKEFRGASHAPVMRDVAGQTDVAPILTSLQARRADQWETKYDTYLITRL